MAASGMTFHAHLASDDKQGHQAHGNGRRLKSNGCARRTATTTVCEVSDHRNLSAGSHVEDTAREA